MFMFKEAGSWGKSEAVKLLELCLAMKNFLCSIAVPSGRSSGLLNLEWKRPLTPSKEEGKMEIGWKKGLERKEEEKEREEKRKDEKVCVSFLYGRLKKN